MQKKFPFNNLVHFGYKNCVADFAINEASNAKGKDVKMPSG